MIQAQPVLDAPTNRLLTYTLYDTEGARVIISVRASIADDDLVKRALNVLAAPPSPVS